MKIKTNPFRNAMYRLILKRGQIISNISFLNKNPSKKNIRRISYWRKQLKKVTWQHDNVTWEAVKYNITY